MRVIAVKTLREFWEQPKYSNAELPLRAWYAEIKKADWNNPHDIKAQFRHASIINQGRVVFNIKGNNYRLVVDVRYDYQIVYIKFIGTHEEYDKLDLKNP